MGFTNLTKRALETGLADPQAALEMEAAVFLRISGTVYYVDNVDGDDNQDGRSWDSAFATIQAAITASNATIDWSYTPKKYNHIFVKPGVYAENLTPPYYCTIEGLGIRGTDTAAEIHSATGSCITGTFLGTVLDNLRMEVDAQDTPMLNLGICNNSRIQRSEFALGASVTGVAAIDTDNATHLVVVDNDFTSGMTQNMGYCAYHRGGADKYAHNVRYIDNRMWAKTAGIWIQNTCTASGALAQYNHIWIDAAGKGIDDNNGGMLISDNTIVGGAGADAIETAGGAGMTTNNWVNIAGTSARETA